MLDKQVDLQKQNASSLYTFPTSYFGQKENLHMP